MNDCFMIAEFPRNWPPGGTQRFRISLCYFNCKSGPLRCCRASRRTNRPHGLRFRILSAIFRNKLKEQAAGHKIARMELLQEP
jgi:hypothetical protein